MARRQFVHPVSPRALPAIRRVGCDRPWVWLQRGWNDLATHPVISLAYGALVAGLFAAVVFVAIATGWYHIALYLLAGFVLVAPLLALSFYEISRRIERAEPVTFGDALGAWRRNRRGTMGIGAMLVLLLLAWVMLSIQLTAVLAIGGMDVAAIVSARDVQGWNAFLLRFFVFRGTLPVLLGFFATGLVVAFVAFLLTAVSLPLLMQERDLDPVTAVVTSYKAVRCNRGPMLLWAVLIALFTALGLGAFVVGLAVTLPLLGHATWHAYRDVLRE